MNRKIILKKSSLIFVLLIIFTSFPVFADESLDCQYTTPTEKFVLVEKIVNNKNQKLGDDIEEFISVKNYFYESKNPCWLKFEIHNSLNYPVRTDIRFTYTFRDMAGLSKTDQKEYYGLDIPEHNFIERSLYIEDGRNCDILNDSFVFTLKDNGFVYKTTFREKKVFDECRLCDSKICKNDGIEATSPKECGSGLLHQNICVPKCPDKNFNCSGFCLEKGTKTYGEVYDCKFECVAGLGRNSTCIECESNGDCLSGGVCNTNLGKCVPFFEGLFDCSIEGDDYVFCPQSNSCVLPGAKKNGESYDCEFECEFGEGNGYVCVYNSFQMFFFILAGIIVCVFILISIIYLYLYQKNKGAISKLKKDVESRKKYNRELERVLHLEENSLKNELIEVRSAKKKVDQEIEKIKEENKRKWDIVKKPFPCPVKQLKGRMVYTEPERSGYVCFYDEKQKNPYTKRPIHIWLAKRFIFSGNEELYPKYPAGYEVHHIDFNKQNNSLKNLIVLKKKKHVEVHKFMQKGCSGEEALWRAKVTMPPHLSEN